MGIRRRQLIGGLLQGAGSGISDLASLMYRQQQQQQQQAFELQKLRYGGIRDLRDKIAADPSKFDLYKQGAENDPLLRGFDASSLRPSNEVLLRGLSEKLNTAGSPEAIPADIGAAASSLGAKLPSVPLGNAAQFGAQSDYADAPPELQKLLGIATSRLGQLNEAKQGNIDDLQAKEYAKNFGGASGTNAATNANAPNARANKVADLQATGPVEAANAGLTTGAQKRAGLAPDIVQGETSAAGAKAGAEERAKLAAQLARSGLTTQQQTAALQLGDDFRQESQTFRTQETNFRTLLTASKEPSAAGDLSIIFSYMKLLDPPSSVREGEQATASNAVGVPAQVRNWYNRVATGERLAPEQRADFVKQAMGIYTSAVDGQNRVIADYLKRAGMLGVPAELVIRQPDPALQKPPKGSTLDNLLNRGRGGQP